MILSKKIIIGVDVGGTKIQAGGISQDGKIICEPVNMYYEILCKEDILL